MKVYLLKVLLKKLINFMQRVIMQLWSKASCAWCNQDPLLAMGDKLSKLSLSLFGIHWSIPIYKVDYFQN